MSTDHSIPIDIRQSSVVHRLLPTCVSLRDPSVTYRQVARPGPVRPQIHRLWTVLWVVLTPGIPGNTPGTVHRRTLDDPQHTPPPPRVGPSTAPRGPGTHRPSTFAGTTLRTTLWTDCARARQPWDDASASTPRASSSTCCPRRHPHPRSAPAAGCRRLSTVSTPPKKMMSPLSIHSLPHAWLLPCLWTYEP